MKQAVKTRVKAIEVLQKWDDDPQTHVMSESGRCECGETVRLSLCKHGQRLASIAVCDACGSDEAYEDEIICL